MLRRAAFWPILIIQQRQGFILRIKIYGCKGSLPFSSAAKARYGSNTPCMLVETNGRRIILDCGSGLALLQTELEQAGDCWQTEDYDILLGHLHLDHIIGLSSFAPMWCQGSKTRLHTLRRGNLPMKEQVLGIYKPPYWPLNLAQTLTAEIRGFDAYEPFFLGSEIRVTPFSLTHPDQTTGFRLDADCSLVYLLDCELGDDPAAFEALAAHCKDADLVIFDCSYFPDELAEKKGWGHSSYTQGVHLAQLSNCKQMIFSHFNPWYTDEQIDHLKQGVDISGGKFLLAYDGMELTVNG